VLEVFLHIWVLYCKFCVCIHPNVCTWNNSCSGSPSIECFFSTSCKQFKILFLEFTHRGLFMPGNVSGKANLSLSNIRPFVFGDLSFYLNFFSILKNLFLNYFLMMLFAHSSVAECIFKSF
jgi:hypothetical protein